MKRPAPQFVAREFGPALIVGLVLAEVALWVVARPDGEPTGSYVGQLLGAEAILLLSIGLVLISTLPWVEVWFDGIDRAAIWHRRVAITGLVLLAPHVLLSSNPNGTALGGPLGVIGLLGLLALVLWAILPRWQSELLGLRWRHVDWVAQRIRVRDAYVRGEHSGEGKSDESTRRSVPVPDEAFDHAEVQEGTQGRRRTRHPLPRPASHRDADGRCRPSAAVHPGDDGPRRRQDHADPLALPAVGARASTNRSGDAADAISRLNRISRVRLWVVVGG